MSSFTTSQIAEAIYGMDEVELKAKFTPEAADAARKRARALGYRHTSDFVRAVVHVATFGAEEIEKCHLGRLRGMGQPRAESGPDSGFGSDL